jgi:hypothetical protein
LLVLPFQVVSDIIYPHLPVNLGLTNIKTAPLVGAYGLANLLYFLFYILTLAAGIVAIKRIVDNEQIDFKKTLSIAWKNLWKFFLVTALVFLATFGGFILLIIPGVIFGIWFYFANFIFIDQGTGITASMGKSRQLVKGKFWAVFWRILIFDIFLIAAQAVVSFIPFGIGADLLTLTGALFMLPPYLLYKELSA